MNKIPSWTLVGCTESSSVTDQMHALLRSQLGLCNDRVVEVFNVLVFMPMILNTKHPRGLLMHRMYTKSIHQCITNSVKEPSAELGLMG